MFLDALSAGPDPSMMTCPAILKGYMLNTEASTSRAKSEHRAAATARVQELEPYFQQCGGWAAVSASKPKSTPALPAPGGGGGGGGMTPDTFGPGGGGGGGRPIGSQGAPQQREINWQGIAMIAGGGVALLLVLGMLMKRRGKGRASAASSIVKSASEPISV